MMTLHMRDAPCDVEGEKSRKKRLTLYKKIRLSTDFLSVFVKLKMTSEVERDVSCAPHGQQQENLIQYESLPSA
jgi:hypothetical protein